MTQTEIQKTGTTTLQLRLAVVEYSTLPHQAAEAEMIKLELQRRDPSLGGMLKMDPAA